MHQQYISKEEERDCQTLGWTASVRMHSEQREPTHALTVLRMVEERNVPQRATRRPDMLTESYMLGYV